jgi:hypothetical protein
MDVPEALLWGFHKSRSGVGFSIAGEGRLCSQYRRRGAEGTGVGRRELFAAKDVATLLEYPDTDDAVRRHCKAPVKRRVVVAGRSSARCLD